MHNITLLAQKPDAMKKLAIELGRYNFICSVFGTDIPGIEQAMEQKTDAFLVDLHNLPDSERLCRYLRNDKKLPVLAIASLETAINLDGTVDDFVSTASPAAEIAVRTRRLLEKRRSTGDQSQIRAGRILIDTEKYEVVVDGRLISLTFKEYELLKFLASNPGRAFTRDTLLNRVWGDDYFGGDRTVDVHIRRLRSKIGNQTTTYIETVRRIGYRFLHTPPLAKH